MPRQPDSSAPITMKISRCERSQNGAKADPTVPIISRGIWGRSRKAGLARLHQELKRSVEASGTEVQTEYDQHFRRLGETFARGDGLFIFEGKLLPGKRLTAADIGRNTLLQQLVVLPSTVIHLIAGSDAPTNNHSFQIVHRNHDRISQTSSSVRQETLTALAEQLQRLAQAATIPSSPTGFAVANSSDAMEPTNAPNSPPYAESRPLPAG
jgi:YD repeat-containing protein